MSKLWTFKDLRASPKGGSNHWNSKHTYTYMYILVLNCEVFNFFGNPTQNFLKQIELQWIELSIRGALRLPFKIT